MKFITLHAPNGDAVHVKAESVTRIVREGVHTRVDFGGLMQFVNETPDEVLAALKSEN